MDCELKENSPPLYAEVKQPRLQKTQRELNDIGNVTDGETCRGEAWSSSQGKYAVIDKAKLAGFNSYEIVGQQKVTSRVQDKQEPVKCCNKSVPLGYFILATIGQLMIFVIFIATLFIEITSIQNKVENYKDKRNETEIELFHNSSFEFDRIRTQILNNSLSINTVTHLLAQVTESINMHNQTLISLEERVRYQISTVSSCADLLRIDSSAPSGLYWIRSSSGTGVQVYCDMNRTCGNITGGWMRVADVSVGANSDSCPGELYQIGSSNHYACKIEIPNSALPSLFFSTHNTRYSHICGEVTAYQMGSLKAFNRLSAVDTNRNSDELTIDMSYVDGISITHGCPRKHIWTFAAAHNGQGQSSCPCNDGHQPPSFVGNNYTCDLGCNPCNIDNNDYYRLWEGSSCDFYQPCCSNSRVPFFKLLSQPTTDYIELRVMNEDILIDNINILVQ